MKRLLLVFLLAPSFAHSAAITTPIFEYDDVRQAVAVDMAQFSQGFDTTMLFVFMDYQPRENTQVIGGALFWNYWNQTHRVDAGVFRGSLHGASYYAWDSSLNMSDVVLNYRHDAVDPNNAIYGYTNNIRYFTDIWDYQAGETTLYIQPLGDVVTEDDFYNRFFYVAEEWSGGPSPTEWLQPHIPSPTPIPIPSTMLLLGSACLVGLVGGRKVRHPA